MVATLAAAAIIAACGSGNAAKRQDATNEGATSAPTFAPLPAVVQETLDAVAKLRGLSAPPALRAKVVTREEMPAAFEAALTDDDRTWFARTTTLYRLLGYLRADQDYYSLYVSLADSDILGFYNPLNDTLVVGTEGGTASFEALSAGERGVLVHELVHAIQDHHFRLDEKFKTVVDDLDRNLAYTAVVEGDANTHQQLYRRRAGLAAGPHVFLTLSGTQQLPLPIAREFQFPYTMGADWITGVRGKGGTAAIDQLLETPPSGTWQVLHPDRTGFTPAEAPLPDLSRALGEGWNRDSGGTFGEFQWGNFLQTRLRGLDSLAAASSWIGDGYGVYRNGGESIAVFSARTTASGDAKLSAAVREWIASSRTHMTEGEHVAIGIESDGRTFLIMDYPGGFLFVVASNEALARRIPQALFSG